MKTILTASIVYLSLAFTVLAVGPKQQIEWIVTYKDGTKSRVTASFLNDDAVSIPVYMDAPSICVLTFSPDSNASTVDGKSSYAGIFSIRPVSSTGEVTDKPIFSARLPVTLGQEIKLLENTSFTATVTITSVEDKK